MKKLSANTPPYCKQNGGRKCSEGSHARKLYHTNKPMIDNRAISVKPATPAGRRALRPQNKKIIP
jgi:hypothetical protein